MQELIKLTVILSSQIYVTSAIKSFILVNFLLLKVSFYLIMPQISSIGLRSGELGGWG